MGRQAKNIADKSCNVAWPNAEHGELGGPGDEDLEMLEGEASDDDKDEVKDDELEQEVSACIRMFAADLDEIDHDPLANAADTLTQRAIGHGIAAQLPTNA